MCTGLFEKSGALLETCLHGNPAYLADHRSSSACADLQKEIDAGLIVYDAARGGACLRAVQALTCPFLISDGDTALPDCGGAMVGTVATGGTCWSSGDCAAGYCTGGVTTTTCPGTCQPFTALGGSCTGETCAPGQRCDGSLGGARTCKTRSAAGGPCPCQPGHWCDTSGAAAVCRAALPVGASCGPGSGPCALSQCAGTPPTCKALLGPGATCDPASSLCGPGYVCDPVTTTCISLPTSGQPCTDECIGGYCDLAPASPVCKAAPDGATCNPALHGADCASGFCDATSKCGRSPGERCAMP